MIFLLTFVVAACGSAERVSAPSTTVTGGGGFLQSVVNGYGGLRLEAAGLRLRRPRPPPNCTRLVLRGVAFRGARGGCGRDEHLRKRQDGTHFGMACEPCL